MRLALTIDMIVKQIRPADWRGVTARENIIKAALLPILLEETEVERVFLILTAQSEY
jgi:type I restriction enzyme R subunit